MTVNNTILWNNNELTGKEIYIGEIAVSKKSGDVLKASGVGSCLIIIYNSWVSYWGSPKFYI